MFSRYAPASAVLAALLAAALTSCSNNSSDSSTDASKTSRPSASASAKDRPSDSKAKAPQDQPAIVLGQCNADVKRKLTFIKPDTDETRVRGGIISTKYINMSFGQQSLFSCMGARTGAMERAAFDKGLEKLAVMQTMQDDETLAGYVTPGLIEDDEATGSMRDLSGPRAEDDGFGAKKQRSIPAFDPTTGNMVFVENGDPGRLLSINPNVGATEDAKPKEVSDPDDVVNTTADDDALYFFPHSGRVQNDYRTRAVYSPDGKMGFAQGDSNNIVYGDLDGGKTKTVELPIVDGDYVGLEPVAYLGEDSFIAVSGVTSNKLYRVTLTGNSLSIKQMLIDTDGSIYDVTLSPDGKTMVFLLEKSDTSTLFTAKVGTKVTPTLLRELEDATHLNTKILAWQAIAA